MRRYPFTWRGEVRLPTASGVLLLVLLSGCGSKSPPPFISLTATPNPARAGEEVVFKAVPESTKKCGSSSAKLHYKWSFADGVVVRQKGPLAIARFTTPGRARVVSARTTGCFGEISGGAYVWVVHHVPSCGKGKPFDLIWQGLHDPNGLPLNPEWRWQCAYAGFPVEQSFLKPGYFDTQLVAANRFCDGFSWANGHRLDVGTDCSSQISGTDYPSRGDNPLWYAICHANTQPPYGVDADTTVHGHVNWLPVTYAGRLELTNIQGTLPLELGDGDADLDLYPDPSAAPQYLTHTLPGGTMNPRDASRPGPDDWKIHAEFRMDEVLTAFRTRDARQSVWETSFAALMNHRVRGVAIGLFGLDARHGSYSELHPTYAMALQETQTSGSSKWLIFARNDGREGGCSSGRLEPLVRRSITMLLPLPPGLVQQFSTRGSYYTTPAAVKVTRDGANARVTIALPAPSTTAAVAGELDLQTTTAQRHARGLSTVSPKRVTALKTTQPAKPQDPEDKLRTLAALLPPGPRSNALAAPLNPVAPAVPSAADVCAEFRQPAIEARSHKKHPAQVHLVEDICRAAGSPF